MGLSQVAICVCNDGNVAQLDVTDKLNGGIYYRIEVYRASQPSGGYGVTLSGSRVEDICGIDHLSARSNQIFRYTFSVGDHTTPKGALRTVLEGREEFNPQGTPDGSWDVRIRDLDPTSPSYGTILRATASPKVAPKEYDIHYEFRPATGAKPVEITSGLHAKIADVNPTLSDIGTPLTAIGNPVGILSVGTLGTGGSIPKTMALAAGLKTSAVDSLIAPHLTIMSHQDFTTFRANLDAYEAFGDFGAKATHPGTNLVGPNAVLAAESIFVRQYRAALVLLGRLTSPDMAGGALPASALSLAMAKTNTRPGVYAIFVGAAINNIGIYKLGLDKVHSDYGGIPMKLAPGSRLEDGATPVADATRCNQTLGEIANAYYLAG